MKPLGSTMLETLDITSIRSQFPILSRVVHGSKPLVYLDNAATTQKPYAVLDTIRDFYCKHYANVHRGGHALGTEATNLYEDARRTVAAFVNASADCVVFTKGTTDSVNLVASALAKKHGASAAHSNVVITAMEHHANIVPWQQYCAATGAELRVIPLRENMTLDMDAAEVMINDATTVVAAVHTSNVLGCTNPVQRLCALAAEHGAVSFIDGAQAIVHQGVDIDEIGCDFYTFSGHKIYGPTGIGVLVGRPGAFDDLPPYQTGGAMITRVAYAYSEFAEPPLRFEAGTPNLEGAIGLSSAIQWLQALDRAAVADHEANLTSRLINAVESISGSRILGPKAQHAGIVSFVIAGAHAQDVGMLLDQQGVAVRTGHHCTMPLLETLGVSSAVRVSAALYNTVEEVDVFAESLQRSVSMLR